MSHFDCTQKEAIGELSERMKHVEQSSDKSTTLLESLVRESDHNRKLLVIMNELVTNVAVLTKTMETTCDTVNELKKDVSEIKYRPAKTYRHYKNSAAVFIIGSIIGLLFSILFTF